MNLKTKKPAALLVVLALVCTSALTRGAELDAAKIDQITGANGTLNKEENVYKVSFPREDVKVTVDGVRMPPFMGLTSWAAFKPGMKDGTVMVMGDMVLFQDEVNPAMSAALDNGLSVTALHNLLLRRAEGLLHAHRRRGHRPQLDPPRHSPRACARCRTR